MRLVDPLITQRWWAELLADEERMAKWLLKLQVTELDGLDSNIEADRKYNPGQADKAASRFLLKTGDDEKRHSDMLVALLARRGYQPLPFEPSSIYWAEMDKHVVDLQTCCAVFYFGEKLATERFEIIRDHPGTPSDIMEFINSALPDETYHAKGFRKLAGDDATQSMLVHHNRVMAQLLRGRSRSVGGEAQGSAPQPAG